MTIFSTVEGLSEVQAEVRLEESGSREKYQFLPTAAFRV